MRLHLLCLVAATVFASSLAACSTRSAAPVSPGFSAGQAPSGLRAPVPDIGGVYKGTVVETSQGRSIKAPLKITIKQNGSKFTGIFDIILKTVSDEFPIIKGVVEVSHGKTMLHFVIEGSPGRNARAQAALSGSTIKGKAKVPPKNGPAVRFKYSAKKT
ncbi:MAG TPA: hypothetical protein VHR97_01140 [Candidatus Baltobacteraceae bacterium]|nr:hypothetical protein [Candidatus Baltobacteraceae bacterium]